MIFSSSPFSFVQKISCGFALLTLSACQHVCVMPDDLYQGLNELYPSKNNISQVNQSIGEKEGVPRPVKKMAWVGPVNFERLKEAGIQVQSEPKANARYVTLIFDDKTKEEGVLHEERLNEAGSAFLIHWIPAHKIAKSLRERDSHQFATKYGLKWAHPDFENYKIQTCVGRMTAQGFQEAFPFEAWSYCASPKTKKMINKFHTKFFFDLKTIFYDPIYILLDAS